MQAQRAVLPPSAVVSRLFGEADKRALKHAQAKAAVERASVAAFSFKPAINPTSIAILQNKGSSGEAGPLHERSEEVVRSSAEALHRLRMEAELAGPSAECTFKPRINAHSARLAKEAGREGGAVAAAAPSSPPVPTAVAVTERLTRDGLDAQSRKIALRAAAAAEQASLHPFAPQVRSRRNDALVKSHLAKLEGSGVAPSAAAALAAHDGTSTHDAPAAASAAAAANPGARFLVRQAALLEAQAKHRAEAEAAAAADAACSFKPDIGNAEEFLHLARPARLQEGQGDAAERLAREEGAARAASLAEKQEAFFAQYTFKPSINPASRVLAGSTPHTVDDLISNEKGARVRLRAAALAEAEFRSKHPFQPQLIAAEPTPALVGGDGGGSAVTVVARAPPLRLGVTSDPEHLSERLAEHAAASAAALEAARRRSEYEELKGCTFAPQTAPSRASLARARAAADADGGVVVVHGLGRHLELKELTRRMEEERREREVAAFSVKGSTGTRDGPTVPQPFRFATDARVAPPPPPQQEGARKGSANGAPAARKGAPPPYPLQRQMLEQLLAEDEEEAGRGPVSAGGSSAAIAAARQQLLVRPLAPAYGQQVVAQNSPGRGVGASDITTLLGPAGIDITCW